MTIVVDVSCLGYGHLAQMGPVVDSLASRHPGTRIVVGTDYPAEIVRQFISVPVEWRALPPEATLVLVGPDTVDVGATAAAYEAIHRDWPEIVDVEAARLAALDPSLVISNVSYVTLAAAAQLSIPSIALCSINWLEVYRSFVPAPLIMPSIIEKMRDIYNTADVFLQARPHMPMLELGNRRSIGPIARTGHDRRADLRRVLGASPEKSLVLVTMGGVSQVRPIPLAPHERIHWLVQGTVTNPRSDVTSTRQIDFEFIDLLASVDVVVSKDSYGTITEAACHGTRLVIAPRPGSIEFASIDTWARDQATYVVAGNLYDPEDLLRAVLEALSRPAATPASRTGISEAVEIIAEKAGLS